MWRQRLINWLKRRKQIGPKHTPRIVKKYHKAKMPGRRRTKREKAAGMQ